MIDTSKLKPGDKVAYERRRGRWAITTVERVLATQIVTSDKRRWTRKHGCEVGSSTYARRYIHEATEERMLAAAEADEHESLVARYYRVKWDEKDLETLRRVKVALDGEAA